MAETALRGRILDSRALRCIPIFPVRRYDKSAAGSLALALAAQAKQSSTMSTHKVAADTIEAAGRLALCWPSQLGDKLGNGADC